MNQLAKELGIPDDVNMKLQQQAITGNQAQNLNQEIAETWKTGSAKEVNALLKELAKVDPEAAKQWNGYFKGVRDTESALAYQKQLNVNSSLREAELGTHAEANAIYAQQSYYDQLGPLDKLGVDMHKWADEGPQVWGQEINRTLTDSVNNGNYMDFNVSLGFGTGNTFGTYIDNEQNLRAYFGGGLVTGLSSSLTWSPQSVTEGLNIAFQAQVPGLAVQIGYSNGTQKFWEKPSWNNAYVEFGAGLGMGWSLTAFGVSKPLYNFSKSKRGK